MSAAAIPIYEILIGQGFADAQAKAAAEAIAEAQSKLREGAEDSHRAAERYADEKVAQSEEKLRAEMSMNAERATAQTEQVRRESVSRDEFHERTGELATRGDLKELRTELRSEMTEIRGEIAALNRRADALHERLDNVHRLLHRIFISVIVAGTGTFVAVAAAAVKFIFFGI